MDKSEARLCCCLAHLFAMTFTLSHLNYNPVLLFHIIFGTDYGNACYFQFGVSCFQFGLSFDGNF